MKNKMVFLISLVISRDGMRSLFNITYHHKVLHKNGFVGWLAKSCKNSSAWTAVACKQVFTGCTSPLPDCPGPSICI